MVEAFVMAKKEKKESECISEKEETENVGEDSRALEALSNGLILDEIFSRLSLHDLKSCRQVCSAWCDTAHKFMCKKATIALPLFQFSASNTINEILSCGSFGLPCTSIRVTDPTMKKCSIFDSFIRNHGEEIKEFELETITICKKEFNYLQEILFKKLPFLESFSFGAIQVQIDEAEPNDLENIPSVYSLNSLKRIQCVQQRPSVANSALMENFLRKVIECSPNLEEVKINNANFLQLLAEKLPERAIKNFKNISFVHDRRSGETVNSLVELSGKGLQLKHFEWEDTRQNPVINDLVPFLRIQRNSLKKFSLALTQYNFRNSDLPCFPPLPVMNKLETLQISSVMPMYFQQKDWTVQFPALKRFHYSTLNRSPLQNLVTLLRVGECSPNKQLEYIKISSYHEIDSVALKHVSYLSYKTFPNLKTFVYEFKNKEIKFTQDELLRYLPTELPQALEGLKII